MEGKFEAPERTFRRATRRNGPADPLPPQGAPTSDQNDPSRGPQPILETPPGDLALPEDLETIARPEPEVEHSGRPIGLELPNLESLERLIRDLHSKTLDAATLDTKARRAVVAFLAEGRTPAGKDKAGNKTGGKLVTREQLARLLKVSTKTITADLTVIRKAAGARIVKKWGIEGAIGFLERTAEDCYREARELGDPALAWMIRSNFVKQLKELGAFGAKGENEGFKVTFETVGPQLAALTRKLEDAFRPELTGERVTVEGRSLPLPDMLEAEVSGSRETPVSQSGETLDVSLPDGGDTGELPRLDVSGEPPEDDETNEGQ